MSLPCPFPAADKQCDEPAEIEGLRSLIDLRKFQRHHNCQFLPTCLSLGCAKVNRWRPHEDCLFPFEVELVFAEASRFLFPSVSCCLFPVTKGGLYEVTVHQTIAPGVFP